jgi:hypothetical protein
MTGGLSEPSESFAKLNIEYSGSNYSFLFRLIPQSTGIFSVTMVWYNNDSPACSSFGDCIDLTKQINLGSTEDGRKRVPVYEAIFYVINDGNVNFDLLSANCKAGSLETPNSATAVFAEQKGTYTFRVVE